jgi:formylglycine-generating enzyme required for sulfatase activity
MFIRHLAFSVVLSWSAFAYSAAPNAHSKHPQTFRDCVGCAEMVFIPGGSFTMGSAADDPTADALEQPSHQVRVRSFAAGKFDVSVAEWRKFARATKRPTASGCQWTGKDGPDAEKASWEDLGFPQTPQDPVVCVSWGDAKDYAGWLSNKTGKRYRLLSEAEWEYASRAGVRSAYRWKPGTSHEFANHGTEECCGGLAKGRDKWVNTSPGGAFPPNGFGLYDMNGNVMQWVEDCFAPTYSDTPRDGAADVKSVPINTTGDLKDLNGTMTCDYRVLRGGDWAQQARWIRSAARSFAPPPGPGPRLNNYRSGGVGFRVARDLP